MTEENTPPPSLVSPEIISEVPPAPVVIPPSQQEFPKTVYCQKCRRDFTMRTVNTKMNTLLTEIHMVCPRCRAKLRKFKLKDWYDNYIQGVTPPPKVAD